MFQHQSSAEELLKMNFVQKIKVLKEKLRNTDAVVIGAGSGLSTAADYVYTGERLTKYFGDFGAVIFGSIVTRQFLLIYISNYFH